PLELGVLITALDVFLILWMQNLGFRYVEAFIVTLLGVIAICFGIQIALANPEWGAVIRGFAPTTSIVTNPDMLYLAIGIIGATVMPHNLFLHSGLVQTRQFGTSIEDKREAVKLATIDSTLALTFALVINAAILILAAVTIWYGEAGTAKLLILSQVVLGLALPFAIVPLVMFTADRAKMGALVAPRWVTALAALIAAILIVLNIKLLYDLVAG